MNKSKFLKRSLAAILAILMVVAMVPLSALAAETYDISVNSRKATPSDDGTSYAVTIYNTRLASIDWAPKPDRTVQLKTKRGITLDLPVSNLDLMSEATADKDGKVYTLDLIFTDTKTKEKTEAKLNVTVETSVPNDDVTLQAVRVNQTIGSTTYSAISGTKPENGKITIKIPLGMTYKDVNFETGDVTGNEAKIFVPSSPYAKVTYTQPAVIGAPDAEGAQGKVTVTAPTGRTATYSVVFEQEDGLKGMAVNFGTSHSGQVNFSERTFEKAAGDQILSVYTAYVDFGSVYKDEDGNDVTFTTANSTHIIFSHEKNVQRVEDPADGNGELASSSSTDKTLDEPIQSGEKGENTLKFKAANDGSGSYYTYLTVKTKANGSASYGNTKLVLRPKSQEPDAKTAPILTELQFNGYESIYNEGKELAKSITVNVDASYYEKVGASFLPGRVSLTATKGAKVWILNQNGSRAQVTVDGNGRIGKPDTLTSVKPADPTTEFYVGTINTKDRQFTIRVQDPTDSSLYNDYAVNLASSGHGTSMNTVKLVDPTTKKTIAEAVKSTGNQFIFYIDKTDPAPTGTTTYPDALMTTSVEHEKDDGTFASAPSTIQEFDTEAYRNANGTYGVQLKYKFTAGFFDGIATELDKFGANADHTAKEIILQLKWDGDEREGNLVLQAAEKTDTPAWQTIAIGDVDSTFKKVEFKAGSTKDDLAATVCGTIEFAWKANAGSQANWGTENWFNGAFTDVSDSPLAPDLMAQFFADDVQIKETSAPDAAATVYNTTVAAWSENVPNGKYTLNSALKNAWLVIESDKGVVLTPGGTLNNVKKVGTTDDLTTAQVGVSEWGKDDTAYTTTVYNSSTNPTAMRYEEHENYFTTLNTYWNDNYLITLKSGTNNTQGSATVTATDGNADALLVMTTNNKGASNNDNKQTWTIRFERKDKDPVAPTYSEDAELNIKGATTAVDEDLIYDGRTRKTANQVTLTSGAYNSASEDAPYIGAIAARGDDHNDFKVEISELPDDGSGEKNASVVKIHVPEDYFVNGQIVYLDGVTASAKSTVYRGNEKTALYANAAKPASNWYETNLVQKYSLVMDDQTQTGDNDEASRQFKIQTSVWNGSTLNKNAVSDDNIFYVYSEKDSKKIATAGQDLPTPTRKYYITFVKDNFDTIDTMTGVTAADSSTGITGTPNAYEKWLNLSVPFGKNWTNYRDDSSRDFKLNFTKGGEAILVDAAQDTHNGPFGSASMGTTYLDKARQELREAQIDEDTVFFVKENELWIYDQYTGKETKVTGRGLNTKFTYSGWGVITSGNAELHVFNEDQRSINTYRLTLNVNEASSAKEIVSIRVDETSAVNTSGTLWTVDLGPAGSENLAKVMLNITVSATAQVVSVGGKEYVANGTYDLTKPVTIIVKDENGDTKSFTLSATGDDPNPPVEEKESDKYTDIPSGAMGDWVKDAINYGIMSSNVSGKYEFQPKATTPRRYFALMVARADIMANNGAITTKEAADEKLLADYGNKEPDFKDTAKEDPKIKAAIVYCQEKKIMNGDEKGNFNPGDIVDRMQVASMLANWLKLTPGDKTENTHGFKDWDKIASWAKGNINAVATDKIMEGNDDGTFGTGKLTREQTAVVMVKVYERLKGITD